MAALKRLPRGARLAAGKSLSVADAFRRPDLAWNLEFQCVAVNLPPPEREYCYAMPRRLRADLAWPAQRLLVEVQGGVWTRQAHGSIQGILADNDRLNEATLHGWRMLRFTPDQVEDGTALKLVEQVLTDVAGGG